jgi:hypothetical protein
MKSISQHWGRYCAWINSHTAFFGASFIVVSLLFWMVFASAYYLDSRFQQAHETVVRQNKIILAHGWEGRQ